jgi:class 3 adenylate cyclase
MGPPLAGITTSPGLANLAARLQAQAGSGEILLSDEAHRRVCPWLEKRGLRAVRELLELKGFHDPQPAWRLPDVFQSARSAVVRRPRATTDRS